VSHRLPLTTTGDPGPDDVSLLEALAAAQRAWPKLCFDARELEQWVRERWRDGGVLGHLEDVALACACASGSAPAQQELQTRLRRLARVLRRLGSGRVEPEDVCQALLDRLLVRRGAERPAIARYQGSGPLEAWLRSGLVRTALNLERQGRNEEATDLDELARSATLAAAPELAFVRSKYRAEFATAFRAALSGLSSRDRNLLRLHHLDGVTLEALATMYKVHRATVARWLADARESALEGTRETLRATLQISADELSSLMRSLHSQLHVSLGPALRSAP